MEYRELSLEDKFIWLSNKIETLLKECNKYCKELEDKLNELKSNTNG